MQVCHCHVSTLAFCKTHDMLWNNELGFSHEHNQTKLERIFRRQLAAGDVSLTTGSVWTNLESGKCLVLKQDKNWLRKTTPDGGTGAKSSSTFQPFPLVSNFWPTSTKWHFQPYVLLENTMNWIMLMSVHSSTEGSYLFTRHVQKY